MRSFIQNGAPAGEKGSSARRGGGRGVGRSPRVTSARNLRRGRAGALRPLAGTLPSPRGGCAARGGGCLAHRGTDRSGALRGVAARRAALTAPALRERLRRAAGKGSAGGAQQRAAGGSARCPRRCLVEEEGGCESVGTRGHGTGQPRQHLEERVGTPVRNGPSPPVSALTPSGPASDFCVRGAGFSCA